MYLHTPVYPRKEGVPWYARRVVLVVDSYTSILLHANAGTCSPLIHTPSGVYGVAVMIVEALACAARCGSYGPSGVGYTL